MTTRHIAALAVWLVVVGLLVFGAGAAATLGRPIYWSAGLLGGLALFSAISSLWSGSVELSVIEADRVLAYLGIYLAAFLIVQTDQRRERFAEGLAIAFLAVALLALGSRLLPHVIDIGSLGEGARLYYPLEYWNADGTMFGIGVTTLLWMSRRAAWAPLRWLSAAAIPAVLLALYFTYSRGGLLALLVSAGILLALSRDRLWLTATLAIGALGALPAILAVQARDSLAENLAGQAAVDQGVTVLLILLAGIVLAAALFAGLRALERREGELTGRAVELSRHPTALKVAAAAVAVIAIGVAIAVGGRAWDQFKSSDVAFPEQPSSHFSNLNGAGRSDFWRVAIDSFGEEPVIGTGAGTYRFDWDKKRSIYLPLHDAHSLYLQSFAELGLVGGIIVLALVGGVLWWAFCAWRDAREDRRELHAIVLAALVAMAVAFAIDWFWQILAMGSIFFIYAAVATSARCAQVAPAAGRRREEGRSWGLTAAVLAVAWISAVALVGPLLVEREIDQSQDAAAANDLPSAVDHAEHARSIEPFAASPYVQLGLLAQLEGDHEAAISHFSNAIDREEDNWQWYYLRSTAEREAGDEAAAEADLEKARELNPLEPCLRTGNCG
ncbi:MAG TPA: O-antigen ligase family protein [Solirubrobacterales bacterium]